VFILCCGVFVLIDEWVLLLCYILFFYIPSQEIGLENVSKMAYFVSSGDVKPELSQSIK